MAQLCMGWFLRSWSDDHKSAVDELVELCKGTTATSAKLLKERRRHLTNHEQSALLVKKLYSTHDILAFTQRSSVPQDRKAPALQELHEALLRAKQHIQTSCSIAGNAAYEQGSDMLSSVLYDVQWHTVVLQSILVMESRPDAFTAALCNGTLHPMDEFALQIALEEDKKNALMERPASMKPFSLADQLLSSRSPSRKLSFPSPEDVNLLGIKSVDSFEVAGSEHPGNIVRLLGYFRNTEENIIVMDMNLAKFLKLRKANNDPLGILEAVTLMLQVADGVRFIHSEGMVLHGGLKPSNVLVTLADHRVRSAKVSEFGLCGGGSEMGGRQGDVYSFAMVCAEVLNVEASEKMVSEAKFQRPSLPESCPSRLASLIRSCWAEDLCAQLEFYEICQELRYIKGLLLRGDRLQLEVDFAPNAKRKLNQVIGDKERKQPHGMASTNGTRQGPWGREEPHKRTGLFDHVADSIRWVRLKYQQTPPGIGFMEVGYLEPNGHELAEAYCQNIIGTTWRTIKFEPDEYIKQICGSVGPHEVSVSDSRGKVDLICVVSLTIHTNRRSYGPFGEENERGQFFKSGTGRVTGFFGASGVLLDKLGVWTIPDGQEEADPSFLIEQ